VIENTILNKNRQGLKALVFALPFPSTELVELHKPARVKGDVATPSLMIEKGVMFDGAAKMESAGSNLVTLNRRERESVPAAEAKS